MSVCHRMSLFQLRRKPRGLHLMSVQIEKKSRKLQKASSAHQCCTVIWTPASFSSSTTTTMIASHFPRLYSRISTHAEMIAGDGNTAAAAGDAFTCTLVLSVGVTVLSIITAVHFCGPDRKPKQ